MAWMLGAACDFLGLLLIAAGVLKLTSLRGFGDQLRSIHLFPAPVAALISVAVPVTETILGSLLVSRSYAVGALSASAVLFAAFTAFVAWVLVRRGEVACYCFGEADGAMSKATLVRNVILLGIAGASAFAARSSPPVSGMDGPRVLILGYASCGVLLFLSGFQLKSIERELEKTLE